MYMLKSCKSARYSTNGEDSTIAHRRMKLCVCGRLSDTMTMSLFDINTNDNGMRCLAQSARRFRTELERLIASTTQLEGMFNAAAAPGPAVHVRRLPTQ